MKLTYALAVLGIGLGLKTAHSNPWRPIFFRSQATALRFSRNNRKLLAAVEIYRKTVSTEGISFTESDNRLRVYNPQKGKQIWILPARPISGGNCLLLPNFKTMLTTWGAWDIQSIDIHRYCQGPKIDVLNGSIGAFELSPNEKLMAVGMARSVEIRDAATHKVLRTYEHDGSGTNVQFGPHGKEIFCTFWDSHPQVISTATAKQIPWPRWAYRVEDADAWAFTADGSQLALAKGNTIEIWKTPGKNDGGTRLQTFHCPLIKVETLAFAPNGKILAAGGYSQTIKPVYCFNLHLRR